MALLKQPAKLSQTDKFNYAANRDAPRTHYGKTLKGPEGITAAFPVSMLSLQEKWCDPAETSTVTKYGVSLRYKADIDGTNKTCEWKAAKAVGVKLHQRQHTIHSSKFDVRKVPVRDVVDAACNRYTQLAHAVRVRVQDHTIARAHTHKHTHTHTHVEKDGKVLSRSLQRPRAHGIRQTEQDTVPSTGQRHVCLQRAVGA
jgi:hypothetical protein